jgi:hypothetical protein
MLLIDPVDHRGVLSAWPFLRARVRPDQGTYWRLSLFRYSLPRVVPAFARRTKIRELWPRGIRSNSLETFDRECTVRQVSEQVGLDMKGRSCKTRISGCMCGVLNVYSMPWLATMSCGISVKNSQTPWVDGFHTKPQLIGGREALLCPCEDDQALAFRKTKHFIDSIEVKLR